jgi:hypothetical protein
LTSNPVEFDMREAQAGSETFGAPRRGGWLAAGVLLVFAAGSSLWGDATDPAAALDQQIIAATAKGSEIRANLTYLCDEIGPRLTGSANLKRANAWAAARMKSYGLSNVHQEPWLAPEGWQRGPAAARVIEPNNGQALSIASVAWTPGTPGKVQGDVVVLKAANVKELAAYKGKLKGAVVLAGPPAELGALADVDKAGFLGAWGPKGLARGQDMQAYFAGLRQFFKERGEFLRREGAAVVLQDARKHLGLLFTTGGWAGNERPSASNRLPSAYVAHNHYEMLYRLACRPGQARTRVEVQITNTFLPGPVAVHNTVGEIRGTTKPDEVVVVGAHLDSWDLGQGATDNGTGSCIVLEAARVLAKARVRPRRTIRFILFTGEEQGLHGSTAYVARHKDEMPRITAALVHDSGTGKVTGLAAGGWPAAQKVLQQELTSLAPLGVKRFDGRGAGGSDHLPFEKAGVPGLFLTQEVAGYSLSHHSQADTLDRVIEPNLIQGTQVMAVTAMRLANRATLLPRDRAPQQPAAAAAK